MAKSNLDEGSAIAYFTVNIQGEINYNYYDVAHRVMLSFSFK